MDKIKLVLVEDDPIIVMDLENQLTKSGIEVMASFESGEETLSFLNEGLKPDLFILDIQIYGSMDGIELAQKINENFHIPIIFLTSNTDKYTFNKARLTSPHAFLSKPFRIADVLHSIELALEMYEEDEDIKISIPELKDRIFIRDRESLYKVMFSEILFLEADGAYCKIVKGDKTFAVSQTLGKVYAKLETPQLLKIHRSFVVNIHMIDRISEGNIYINEYTIPVSRTYRDQLWSLFKAL